MDSSSDLALSFVAEVLVRGLQAELDLTPKPGLVDLWDSGSHSDLDHTVMSRSISLLANYFRQSVWLLQHGHALERLRDLGVVTERKMVARLGTNTHRGAIFLGGLFISAVHSSDSIDAESVSDAAAANAQRLFSTHCPMDTKGARTRQQYRTGGIVAEAVNGLPSVFKVGVPALEEANTLELDDRLGTFFALARLMRTVEDTTTLRRCGQSGLITLRRDGALLENLLLGAHDPTEFLIRCNDRYRQCRLTMGGVADLLGICISWRLLVEQCRQAREGTIQDCPTRAQIHCPA